VSPASRAYAPGFHFFSFRPELQLRPRAGSAHRVSLAILFGPAGTTRALTWAALRKAVAVGRIRNSPAWSNHENSNSGPHQGIWQRRKPGDPRRCCSRRSEASWRYKQRLNAICRLSNSQSLRKGGDECSAIDVSLSSRAEGEMASRLSNHSLPDQTAISATRRQGGITGESFDRYSGSFSLGF